MPPQTSRGRPLPPARDLLDAEARAAALLEGFAGDGGTPPDLAAGLDTFCDRARAQLRARRVSVWLHDRRARELVCRASSGDGHAAGAAPVPATGTAHPLARILRAREPSTLAEPPTPDGTDPALGVPLRGRRRALGVLVVEPATPSAAAGEPVADVTETAAWLGRRLAGAIENAQLFDGVIRARRELELTFDSISDLVVVFDRNLIVVEVNRALAERVSSTPAELREQPLASVAGPETHAWVEAAFAGPDDEATPTSAGQLDDSLWRGTFSLSVSSRRGPGGEALGGVLVARDVTDDARLAAERDALRERLSQAEKLAALGQFVAGIAHELNNPLQGAIGHIELVQRTKQLSGDAARDQRIALREADRAATIVRNLLVFAGAPATPRRRLSLNAVVRRALAQRGPALRAAGIEVTTTLASTRARVRGDTLLLHQALLNIITNSEHAMADSPVRRLEVTTTVDPSGDQIAASIRDTGPGIPGAVLPRIFEPFYTTKEVGKGSGLGLAITYGIINDHGGRIDAENVDPGTIFTVHLPIDRETVAN